MKRSILFLFVFVLPLIGFSQEDEGGYIMWETMYMTPDNEHIVKLNANLKKHNETYHKAGTPYAAYVFSVANGPNTGKLVWNMGPCTYTDLDSRPSDGGHDEDWTNNVVPYLEGVSQGEYWKLNPDLSTVSDDSEYSLLQVRYHEVRRGQGYRVNDFFKGIYETIKEMEGDNPWAFYSNEFRQGYTVGRHIATVSFYNSWSELDEDGNFREVYEKLHGPNSWVDLLKQGEEIFTNSWDEFWSLIPDLSSSPAEGGE